MLNTIKPTFLLVFSGSYPDPDQMIAEMDCASIFLEFINYTAALVVDPFGRRWCQIRDALRCLAVGRDPRVTVISLRTGAVFDSTGGRWRRRP